VLDFQTQYHGKECAKHASSGVERSLDKFVQPCILGEAVTYRESFQRAPFDLAC